MTTPIRIWASGKANIIPTTDAQWDEGFDYLATTNDGKPITDNHDFVFKVITEAIKTIQEKPIDDISNLNHIKNPQFLANRLGNPLTGENYAADAEIVDGWIAGSSGCNGVTMTANGIAFTAGSMVYKYSKANGQLLADMKASILAPDGSILTDAVYVAITETASDFVVEVKLQAITDKTAIRSVKLELGDLSKHELLSHDESLKSTAPYLVESKKDSSGYYEKWSDGKVVCMGVTPETLASGKVVVNLPTTLPANDFLVQLTERTLQASSLNTVSIAGYELDTLTTTSFVLIMVKPDGTAKEGDSCSYTVTYTPS